jgi:hypothetical protein
MKRSRPGFAFAKLLLAELPRTRLLGTWVNKGKKKDRLQTSRSGVKELSGLPWRGVSTKD